MSFLHGGDYPGQISRCGEKLKQDNTELAVRYEMRPAVTLAKVKGLKQRKRGADASSEEVDNATLTNANPVTLVGWWPVFVFVSGLFQ